MIRSAPLIRGAGSLSAENLGISAEIVTSVAMIVAHGATANAIGSDERSRAVTGCRRRRYAGGL